MLVLLFLSVIILLLVWGSFIPQIQHVWQVKDTRGISSSYVLFNLFCATEHVFLGSTDMLYRQALSDLVPEFAPASALDWLNLIQLTGVWVLLNVFFLLHLYYFYPTRPYRCLRILMISSIYICFLLITIIPFTLDLTTNIFCTPRVPGTSPKCPLQERVMTPFLRTLHSFFLLPIITIILPVLGFYKQVQRQKRQRHREQTMTPPPATTTTTSSNLNLLLARPRLFQATIFLLSAILWIPRVSPWWKLYSQPPPVEDPSQPSRPYPQLNAFSLFLAWWMVIGFLAVDDVIFGIGQGLLGYLDMAGKESKCFDGDDDGDAERRPLLVAREQGSAYLSDY